MPSDADFPLKKPRAQAAYTPQESWARTTAAKTRKALQGQNDKVRKTVLHWLVGCWIDHAKGQSVVVPDSLQSVSPEIFNLAKTPMPVSTEGLARFYELTHTDRSDTGVYYTPANVARTMARAALARWLSLKAEIDFETADSIFAAKVDLPRDTNPDREGGGSTLDKHKQSHFETPPRQSMPARIPLPYGRGLSKSSVINAQEIVRINLSATQAQHAFDLINQVTVIDPAAGAGELLLAAGEMLVLGLDRLHALTGQPAQTQPVFNGRITGVDIDHMACMIAEYRLTCALPPGLASRCRLVLSFNKKGPNTLAAGGRSDVLLLNPPYVPAYSRRSRKSKIGPVKSASQKTVGRVNLFTSFVARLGTFIHADGVGCIITPDTLTFADSYKPDREKLAARFPGQQWLLISSPLFDATVQNVIGLLWNPGPPGSKKATPQPQPKQTLSAKMSDLPMRVKQSTQVPDSFADAADFAWVSSSPSSADPITFYQHNIEPQVLSLIAAQTGPRLGEIFLVKDGVNPGPASVRKKLVHPIADIESSARKLTPLLTGTQIAFWGFAIGKPTLAIDYDPSRISTAERLAGASLRNPGVFESPKLVSRQTADMPIVGIDSDQSLPTLNSVHCIRAREAKHTELLWGLMAYLNSPAIRLYYGLSGGETRATLPQVRIAWINRLPLPACWMTLFLSLGSPARKATGAGRYTTGPADEMHRLVCRGLGLKKPAEVLEAYKLRYPRMAALDGV